MVDQLRDEVDGLRIETEGDDILSSKGPGDVSIENGVKSGSLTNREAGNLERGQAKVDRKEAKAAANGHVGAGEQKNIQSAENHQSKRIHREKHNERKND